MLDLIFNDYEIIEMDYENIILENVTLGIKLGTFQIGERFPIAHVRLVSGLVELCIIEDDFPFIIYSASMSIQERE